MVLGAGRRLGEVFVSGKLLGQISGDLLESPQMGFPQRLEDDFLAVLLYENGCSFKSKFLRQANGLTPPMLENSGDGHRYVSYLRAGKSN